MREHDLFSADGTRITAWRTGHDGPDVLLSPGLGAVPAAWPDLPATVHSWHHRGTLGSDRPEDESRIGLSDHVADALAVLDDAKVHRCVVMGWSMGVPVAVELAVRHPERVAGLLLVAGVPGDSFTGVLPSVVPADLRRLLGVTTARALRAAGPLLDGVLHRVPLPDLALTAPLKRFLKHDWRWYFTLALALGEAPRPATHRVTCPTTVLIGRYDLLANPASVLEQTAALPQARVRLLPNTHFLPLENPAVVREELRLLLRRADTVDQALDDLLTSRSRPRA
ncbi:alpha/beta hydrolase [Actinosynnema sp. NPDC020468]|uniref:alpha/beta fold hydrolase n=1 Tax=Actinosynnema sp. NPDC020468 TaxID=3154488 RepID=UPI0033E5934E